MTSHSSPCMEREPDAAVSTPRPVSGSDSQLQPPAQSQPATPAMPEGRRLTLTVYGPTGKPDGFTALAHEWNALVSRSHSDTFFLTYEWQTLWWRNLGSGELWILAFHCADSAQLVGIAPLYLSTVREGEDAGKRRFNIVGCIEVSDYLDLIVAKGWSEEVYTALLAWLCGPEAPAWDILDLCNLPQGSPTYTAFPPLAQDSQLHVNVFQEDVAPAIPLPKRFDEYLQNFVDKKQRHEIRRKQRRAERETEVGLYIVGPEHNLEAEVYDFIALQMMSRDDKALFMDQEMKRFFHSVARAMLDAGRLRLIFLTLNGEKAAVLYAFEYKRRLLLYNSGYDPDSYAHLSPGWVLLAYAIQYAIASGYELFDFMQGDEEYKFHFGSQSYKVMRVIARRAQ